VTVFLISCDIFFNLIFKSQITKIKEMMWNEIPNKDGLDKDI
jgi:hypothetical protein